jgi:hypothetical protein
MMNEWAPSLFLPYVFCRCNLEISSIGKLDEELQMYIDVIFIRIMISYRFC